VEREISLDPPKTLKRKAKSMEKQWRKDGKMCEIKATAHKLLAVGKVT
jgi:hypothetical protein